MKHCELCQVLGQKWANELSNVNQQMTHCAESEENVKQPNKEFFSLWKNAEVRTECTCIDQRRGMYFHAGHGHRARTQMRTAEGSANGWFGT